jgi:hypothetical protein
MGGIEQNRNWSLDRQVITVVTLCAGSNSSRQKREILSFSRLDHHCNKHASFYSVGTGDIIPERKAARS